jgi:hypothetical protein
MPIQFTPGNKGNASKLINHIVFDESSSCRCIQEIPNIEKKNLIYPKEPNNIRIAQILNTNGLGGRTRFGDIPSGFAIVDTIGRQSGGSIRPLRNKF